ncbi:MAG: hypothetical protein K8S99_12100 [Planctomycetes bacterium]|nr:hypothetical protein [Planctomycetota bacterium]
MEFQTWREVLEYARWAPSPHNTQHWKFKLIDERRAVLFYDPARLLPIEDGAGRFMASGMGILLEMMSIAAAPLGLEVRGTPLNVPLDASARQPSPFADLELMVRAEPEPLDRELIRQRRTSRLPYNDRPVPPALLEELSRVAERFGHQFEHSNDPAEVAWVVGLNAETMFYDLRDDATRGEIGHWARYSLADAQQRGDGLAAFAMLFPGWLMRLFFEKNRLFQVPGLHQLCKWSYKRSMRGTRTVAWISGKFQEQPDCITAGRALARLWLTMTKHGVYLHPFGSVITNHRSHQYMEEHFAGTQRRHPLWLLVRLGQSDLPPRALRLLLDELIIP